MNTRRLVSLLLLALSACRAFDASDVPATLRAETTAYVAEATAIDRAFQTEQAVVQATAQVVSALVAQSQSVNRQLVATARAIIPPTPVRQVGSAPAEGAGGPVVTAVGNDASAVEGAFVSTSFIESESAGSQFDSTGVTSRKRDSDGCADGYENQFPRDVSQIFVITRAVQVRAGTVIDAEWFNNGQSVSQTSWTVPRDETDFCIWFYLDSQSAAFTPGPWSVRLLADDQPIGGEIPFSIVEAMSEGS